ncbi:hypothetical protein GCM10023191_102070 [Actinoallomurus oryzae]|uniref:Uncharacterized protein n=1 Tax=Actinoallomurus oryzae TaxID=502180 RepID=A0ABP8RAN9_9ACTN
MSYSLELLFSDPVTVGQVARYLDLIRAAGATEDTALEEVHPLGDESVLAGWTYRPEQLPAASDRAELTLPSLVVRDALDVLDDVADSDGDVRDLKGVIEQMRNRLRKAVMAELGLPEA